MLNCNTFAVRFLVSLSILAAGSPAIAQEPAAPPPVREAVDANGVDLLTGKMTSVYEGPSIGPSGGGLGFTRFFRGTGSWDIYVGTVCSASYVIRNSGNGQLHSGTASIVVVAQGREPAARLQLPLNAIETVATQVENSIATDLRRTGNSP